MFAAHHAYMCLISLVTSQANRILRFDQSPFLREAFFPKLSENFGVFFGFENATRDFLPAGWFLSRFRCVPFEAGGQTVEKVEQLLNDEDWRAHCEARQPVTLEKNEIEKKRKRREDNVMNTRIQYT